MSKIFYFNHIAALSISLFIIFTCMSTITSRQLSDICRTFNCGEGTCIPSNTSIGFECQCFPGWRKMHPVIWPSCVVPNCSLDFKCGLGLAPTPSRSLAHLLPVPVRDFQNPCELVWCGEGECVDGGAAQACECDEGAANLMNVLAFPCFKECFLGADCENLGLLPSFNFYPPPPPPSPLAPPPSSGSAPSGPNKASKIGTFIMIVLATSLLT